MYKNVLESIAGIDLYPIVSLVIFFLFFIGVLLWVMKADKSYINKMGCLPLENSQGGNNSGEAIQ